MQKVTEVLVGRTHQVIAKSSIFQVWLKFYPFAPICILNEERKLGILSSSKILVYLCIYYYLLLISIPYLILYFYSYFDHLCIKLNLSKEIKKNKLCNAVNQLREYS